MPKKFIPFAQTAYLPDRLESSVSLPPEVITDLTNWKIREGVLTVVPGYFNPITAFTSTTSLAGVPYYGTNLNFSDDSEILYLTDTGSDNQFYKAINGSDAVTSTIQTLNGNPATFTTGSKYMWNSKDWGETTIIHNPAYAPMYATSGSSNNNLTTIPNWGSSDKTDYMMTMPTFLMGLGFHGDLPNNGGSVDSKRVIITSSRITQFNQYPEWALGTDSGTTTSAIYPIDGLVDGDLVAGGNLGSGAVAYTGVNSIRIQDLGDGTVSLESLFTDVGLLAPNAFCNIPNGHFVIGNGQVYTHDNSSKNVIGQDQWSKTLFSRIDSSKLEQVNCVYNPRENTVWMMIPTTTDKEIWVYNLATGQIETVYSQQASLNYLFFSSEGLPFSSLTGSNIPFPTAPELYSEGNRAFRNRMIAMGGESGTSSFFVHELGLDFGGTAIEAEFSRGGIKPSDGYSQTQMMGAIPYYNGNGNLTMSFGGATNSGDTPVYVVTKVMTRGVDTKMDIRFTKRYLAYKMSSSSSGLSIAGFEVTESEKYKR